MNFDELALEPDILEALKEMGYLQPAAIQEAAIPIILEGSDVLGMAETGSGKTAACAIPICNKVDMTSRNIQALILVPTRELALQYATETQKIGKYKKVKVFALFGGEDMALQKAKLKDGVQVLIATLGKLIDFVYSRSIDLSHVKMVAVDEADEMMGMGFLEDLEFILHCMMQEHQTLLFSATMPEPLRKLAQKYMRSPKELKMLQKKSGPETLKHHLYYCQSGTNKISDLITVLKTLRPVQSLVFVNSRIEAEEIYRKLKGQFGEIDFLHGGLQQDVRTIVTNKFSRGKIRCLIATDIAARGLDFSQVTHVINLHLHKEAETYLHRAGRTARFGKEGAAVTLVSHREVARAQKMIKDPIWINNPPRP
jgi:ATP-dependent RNA helicase DeaD